MTPPITSPDKPLPGFDEFPNVQVWQFAAAPGWTMFFTDAPWLVTVIGAGVSTWWLIMWVQRWMRPGGQPPKRPPSARGWSAIV